MATTKAVRVTEGESVARATRSYEVTEEEIASLNLPPLAEGDGYLSVTGAAKAIGVRPATVRKAVSRNRAGLPVELKPAYRNEKGWLIFRLSDAVAYRQSVVDKRRRLFNQRQNYWKTLCVQRTAELDEARAGKAALEAKYMAAIGEINRLAELLKVGERPAVSRPGGVKYSRGWAPKTPGGPARMVIEQIVDDEEELAPVAVAR